MNHQFKRLMGLSKRRTELAHVKLANAEKAVTMAEEKAATAENQLESLKATFDERRERILDGFIGAPSVRLDIDEVRQLLCDLDNEVLNGEKVLSEALEAVAKTRKLKAQAIEVMKHAERGKLRRDSALTPAIKAKLQKRELAQEFDQEEDFLNAFGR